MTKNTPRLSNKLIWIVCALLVLAGISLAVHALLTYNQSDVIVEWTTASELDTIGFNLQRGDSPEGPFQQVNTKLIPAANDTLTGSSYSFEDNSALSGTTYFYMLEEVESTGKTNQHGPIVVEASNPAKIELLVAALLIIASLIYAALLLRSPNQKKQSSENE